MAFCSLYNTRRPSTGCDIVLTDGSTATTAISLGGTQFHDARRTSGQFSDLTLWRDSAMATLPNALANTDATLTSKTAVRKVMRLA